MLSDEIQPIFPSANLIFFQSSRASKTCTFVPSCSSKTSSEFEEGALFTDILGENTMAYLVFFAF